MAERAVRVNRVEALMGILFNVNPLEFLTSAGSQLWASFVHPKVGRISIYEYEIFSENKSFSCGYKTPQFEAFVDGYEGTGGKPSFDHPVLRYYYNKGLKAWEKFNS